MNTQNLKNIVMLIAVYFLMISGCSGISYTVAPTETATASPQEATSGLMSAETAQPLAQELAVPELTTPEASEALTVTLDGLVGIWFKGDYIEFKSNGTYAVYTSLEAFQADVRIDEGNFGVQGDQVWLGPMSSHCNGMGFYQLTSKSENELEFSQIREECSRYLGRLKRVTP